jgi:hypothetical protein
MALLWRIDPSEERTLQSSTEYLMVPVNKRKWHLCSTYKDFDIHSFTRDPFGFRGYKYMAVKAAAAADEGCSFCSLMAECFNNSLSRGASSLPNHWQERWWIHLGIAEPSTLQDIESGGTGLGISMFRATLATANYTLPYSLELDPSASIQITGVPRCC